MADVIPPEGKNKERMRDGPHKQFDTTHCDTAQSSVSLTVH